MFASRLQVDGQGAFTSTATPVLCVCKFMLVNFVALLDQEQQPSTNNSDLDIFILKTINIRIRERERERG